MADNKKIDGSKIDALYQWISYDLQKVREELMNELKLSSAQIGYLYKGIRGDKESAAVALENEIRYSYKQNQNIYEGLANLLKNEVAEKINAIDEKTASLEQLQAILNEISDLKYTCNQLQSIYESISSTLSGEVVPKLDQIVGKEDMQALVEESVSVHSDKVEGTVIERSQMLEEAIAALPAPEAVDYDRITEEVGDKLLELLSAIKANEEALAEEEANAMANVDYERIAGDTAAKVIESMPYPDQFDYNRIDESMLSALTETLNVDALSQAIVEKIDSPEIDDIADAVAAKVVIPEAPAMPEVPTVEDISNAVAEKIVIPEAPAMPEVPTTEEIANAVVAKMPAMDLDALSALVAAKLVMPDVNAIADAVVAKMTVPTVDYDKLADAVLDKLAERGMSADVVLDDEGVSKIAATVAEKVNVGENVDYERITAIVENLEKVVTLDDEGVDKIVNGVAEELRNMTLVCEYVEEEKAEEPTEEVEEELDPVVAEEPAEEIVEEAIEEVVEELVEEAAIEAVEEVVEETVVTEEPAVEELAIAAEPIYEEDMDGQLIDAETGLVIRLKRSFTAKMKQSEEHVKIYYSDIKNALTSYKRINSNVSWHGDRFNYGRDTVAKIGVNGKTLCFYLALDPNDPELKTTVYHQKDVGNQKAYESTPFLVKVKSEAAAKKALRLVGILAEKLGAEHDDSFQEVDYVKEYAYESTKRLFEQGDIKATKEKKVDFDF